MPIVTVETEQYFVCIVKVRHCERCNSIECFTECFYGNFMSPAVMERA